MQSNTSREPAALGHLPCRPAHITYYYLFLLLSAIRNAKKIALQQATLCTCLVIKRSGLKVS